MKIKRGPKPKTENQEFLDSLMLLKPGEYFSVDKLTPYMRTSITVLGYVEKRLFYTNRISSEEFIVGRH